MHCLKYNSCRNTLQSTYAGYHAYLLEDLLRKSEGWESLVNKISPY